MVFGRNPDKLEQKALVYEQKGKTAKAIKCREKAARLRAGHTYPTTQQGFYTTRTPQVYEQKAVTWEQRGNWNKAQKNREKVWRLQNPQYGAQYAAPQFYSQNRFLGYNVPYTPLMKGAPLATGAPLVAGQQVLPAVVETHVLPTVLQQTTRAERIVEVQPVVHREIDAPQVHVIEKHLYETVPSTGPNVITKGAIIEETVKPRIIEEIQPVVHREVPAPFVERVEQHVTEHITQPTITTKEVINDATIRPVGMAAGAPLQQVPILPGNAPLNNNLNAPRRL